jgi:predicted secreted protein
MRNKAWLLALVLFSGVLYAGDVASFANLGFSADGRYFMFAQYGIQEESSFPYVDLFVVDVTANEFVDGGVIKKTYSKAAEPGFIGEGALYTIIGDSAALKGKYGVDHLETGRILYLLVDGEEPKEDLDFRDFVSGIRYKVNLQQNVYGSNENVRSSFYIDLTVIAKNGTAKYYRVGLPNYQRRGIKSYRIKQVLLSPDGKSLVFLIEREEVDKSGSNIRYMVETVVIA